MIPWNPCGSFMLHHWRPEVAVSDVCINDFHVHHVLIDGPLLVGPKGLGLRYPCPPPNMAGKTEAHEDAGRDNRGHEGAGRVGAIRGQGTDHQDGH